MVPEQHPAAAEPLPPYRLDLYSLPKLEYLLGFSRQQLRAVAARAGAHYKPFPKKDKVRPFQKKSKPTKKRVIDNPTGELKAVQSKIHRNLLKSINLPHYLCGGVKGKTVLDNVALHFGAPVLITIDIKNFFPSISNVQVYQVWRKILNCSPTISKILTELTTFERRLPQGAPTSTLLANLVLFSVDGPIRAECARHSVRYSTWVDDLALSGKDAPTVINLAVKVLGEAGFGISHRKMKIMRGGTRKVLNGVLLGRFPSVLPDRLAQLRSGVHKLRTNQIVPDELEEYIRSLEGRISQLASVVPQKAKKLRGDFDVARRQAFARV